MKKFILFGIIGTVGFTVDSMVLFFMVKYQGFDLVLSRVCSFSLAVFATWLLNRTFTFNDSEINIKKSKEYIQYLTVQTIGAFINFSVFFILIYFVEFFKDMLIAPLAIGAFFSLLFNFVVTKRRIYYRK